MTGGVILLFLSCHLSHVSCAISVVLYLCHMYDVQNEAFSYGFFGFLLAVFYTLIVSFVTWLCQRHVLG